jgi:DNA helicase-2/ATP-dependent DNA helicase PcrA
MFYIADLHVHSRFSRATSKNLNLESLYQWAQIKGINVIGTGDFTHPQWFKEIQEKLEPDGNGFFKLKEPPRTGGLPDAKVRNIDVRFCLSSEISSIYKYGDKVRKNHNLVYAPDLETVARINTRLSVIGNLNADGRPILGLPSRDLLEIVTECSERAYLIPAHVWTPWFSTLGSKGGYNSVDECFRDLSDLIFALETGLSSDPKMNWRWSALDRFALVSNSDAHSPQKLGREASLFDTELSYDGLFNALKLRNGFLGTYEFFPQEGKYHLDGHRKCGVILDPAETIRHKGICPVCGQPLTVGVLNRVESLSDRQQPEKPGNAAGYKYLIPLPEILAEIKGAGPTSKAVQRAFQQTLSIFGNEFSLLNEVPLEDIRKQGDILLSEAISRMRKGDVSPQSGYDGVYGVIKVFKDGEIEKLNGQLHLFGMPDVALQKTDKQKNKNKSNYEVPETHTAVAEPETALKDGGLNAAQLEVKDSISGAILVKAGPGTGKTGTLIQWIKKQVESNAAKPSEILAITFTNKAAKEIGDRLQCVSENFDGHIMTGTFHSIAWQILQKQDPKLKVVYDESNRLSVLGFLFSDLTGKECRNLSQAMAGYFECGQLPELSDFYDYVLAYQNFLNENGAVDISNLISQVVEGWKEHPNLLEEQRQAVKSIAVDEFQDINSMQYEFIRLLAKEKNILAIGDPDQAIYGFRGSDVRLFFQFIDDFHPKEVSLTRNYRSLPTVVNAASSVIRHNSLRSDIELHAMRRGNQKIKLFKGSTPEHEATFILREIEKKIGGVNLLSGGEAYDGNYAFSDIAVLYRTHHVGKQLLSTFRKANIPVVTADATGWFSKPPFSFITNTFRLYLNPLDIMALEDVLKYLPGWQSNDVRSFMRKVYESGINWSDADGECPGNKMRQEFTAWMDFYKQISEILEKGDVRNVVEMLFDKYFSKNDADQEQLVKMHTILSMATDAGSDVRKFLEDTLLNNYTDAARQSVQGVRLLTFHASKGLEFPVVFIAGAEEGITPAGHHDSDVEEERRLFYVAMTRARDELYLTHAVRRIIYGKEEHNTRSSFIAEIPANFISPVLPQNVSEKRAGERGNQLSLFSM